MRILLLMAASFLFVSQAQAALVVSVRPDTPGTIILGDSATFSVFIRSDAGPVSNLRGLDFFLDAADPTQTGSRTAGGRFVSGTNELFPVGTANYQLPFPTSLALFSGSSSTDLSVGTVDALVAKLTLSTVGATAGNYVMGLTGITAADAGFNPIAASSGTPTLQYSISAVPEPSSLCLIGLALATACLRRRRCRI